jgi:hypothetical protein
MPENPQVSSSSPGPFVAVTHYASERSDAYVMGASLSAPGYEVESVQVETRHQLRATARSTANTIHGHLANLHSTTLSGRAYFAVDEEGTPSTLGQDQNGLWRIVANYTIKKARG